jgi:hypothetical protein
MTVYGDKVEDRMMRIVVATMNNAATLLSRTAAAHLRESPVAAEHIQRLSQEVAAVTLDALRNWPRPTEPLGRC